MAASIHPVGTVIVTQPSSQIGNPFKQFNGNWNVGLMSCCNDVGQCCYAYFCCCCFLCSLAENIGESKCSACCVPNVLALYRMKVRSVLHIQGDSCNDHCVTMFCPFCAGLQMQNELKFRRVAYA